MKNHFLFSLLAVTALLVSFSHCDTINNPGTLRLQIVQSDGRSGTIPEQAKDLYIGIYLEEVFSDNLYRIYKMNPAHTAAVSVPPGVPLQVVLLLTNNYDGRVILQGSTSESVMVGGSEETTAYITAEYLVPSEPATPMSVVVYPEPASPSTFDVHWQPEFSVLHMETMQYIISRAKVDQGGEISPEMFEEVTRCDINNFSDGIAASYDQQNFTIYYKWQVSYDDFGLESVEIEMASLDCPWMT